MSKDGRVTVRLNKLYPLVLELVGEYGKPGKYIKTLVEKDLKKRGKL